MDLDIANGNTENYFGPGLQSIPYKLLLSSNCGILAVTWHTGTRRHNHYGFIEGRDILDTVETTRPSL